MPPTLVKCCFFQSCYPRVFGRGSRLLTAAAVEAAGARGAPSGWEEGMVPPACSGI